MKKKPIILNKATIEKIKKEACAEAFDKATLLFFTAAKDSLKLSDEKLVKLAETTSRYAEYVDDNLVSLKQTQEILEKNTGLKFIGW